MRTPKPRNEAKRITLLLVPVVFLLLYFSVTWIWNRVIFAAFTDFKRTLADTSIIDGAHLKKQELEIGIDPYEIVEMQLPKGQGAKLLSKNILKYCVDKSQECTAPIWQCISEYNTFGDNGQKATTTDNCTATWWKIRDGFRNYIDQVCLDIKSDPLVYEYIET